MILEGIMTLFLLVPTEAREEAWRIPAKRDGSLKPLRSFSFLRLPCSVADTVFFSRSEFSDPKNPFFHKQGSHDAHGDFSTSRGTTLMMLRI